MSNSQNLAAALLNVSHKEVQEYIEERLRARLLANIHPLNAKGKPTREALREQASFLAGAMVALQAVFARDSAAMTDYARPSWVYAVMHGELVVNVKEDGS
jgi:hypothetical protein